MAQFNSYIDFLDLRAATDYCLGQGTQCHYKKGERFVQQGIVARYAALVVSGYFKVATLNDSGDDAVINFAFPGQLITDFHSSLHGKPSQMSIIAGCECEILRVPLMTFREYLSPRCSTNINRCSIWYSCGASISTASRHVSVMWNCVNDIHKLSRLLH